MKRTNVFFQRMSLLLMLMGLLTFAVAQGPGQGGEQGQGRRGGGMRNMDPAEMATRQTEKMTTDLTLAEDQIEAVYAVNLQFAEMMKANMETNQGDRQLMMGMMTDIRAKRLKAMKDVLTKEQYKVFRKAELEQQENFQNRGPGGRGPGGE